MDVRSISGTFVVAAAPLLALAGPAATVPVCPIALHEERIELEDAELAVLVARADFAAFQEIHALIDGLWNADAVDRMTWLEAGYDLASARLALERAELLLTRQRSLLDSLRAACGSGGSAPDAYLRADCAQQAKAVEVAANDLAFARERLASVLDLREGRVATRQDEILARLDVTREEIRLADARARTDACRAALEPAPKAGTR